MQSEPQEHEDFLEVRVIQRKGVAALVERITDDGPMRRIVPLSALEWLDKQRARLSALTLEHGIEYGIPWPDLLTPHCISVETLAAALRRAGIWTVEDYERNGAAVQSALLETISPVFASVAGAAKKHKHQEK